MFGVILEWGCVVCCGAIDVYCMISVRYFFFFQAEDGIRDLVRSRGLGDVYKRQLPSSSAINLAAF